jgi:type II secretory pathway predicted ATPase ExeA
MYEAFFELTATPFTRDMPVDILYESPMLEETLGRLTYAAKGQLFAVVTGDVGCGKTTTIRRFVNDLDTSKYKVLYVSDSKLTPRWFYKGLLEQLGIESKFYRGDSKRQLHKEIEIIRGIQGKTLITIIDEAHLLAKETFEEIRFLLNYNMDSMSPMSLILVGQNELWDKLRMQSYAAIRQRIDIKCELIQYDRSQVESYIKAHLGYAGSSNEVFTEKAIDEIYKYSAGSARSINKLCTHCLLYACQRAKKLIDDHMVKKVIEGEMP